MAIVIKPKRSETASSTPTVSDLAVGEIAVNTADSKLYIRDSDDNIKSIGGANVIQFPYDDTDLGDLSYATQNSDLGELGGLVSYPNGNYDNLTVHTSLTVNGTTISTYGLTLIDDADAATARTTLGLGTAATTASTDYATAAQGALADSAVQNLSDLSITATATEINNLDGVTGITLGNANDLLVVGSDGSSIASNSTLAVDTASNRLGINQSSPEVTLHMTGEGAQTAQIRMEQYNDSADAPDLRTRRYRGTIASPSSISSGDYLYRSNHEYWNGSALIVGGTFAFDNTNNANRTQFAVSVTTDGTSADANTPSKTQFKIDGNDSGAITFNNAYKFPTSDGTSGQVLSTDGSGTLSFQDGGASTGKAIAMAMIFGG
jgi:hypothetical protein